MRLMGIGSVHRSTIGVMLIISLTLFACADAPHYIPGPDYGSGMQGGALVRTIAASQRAIRRAAYPPHILGMKIIDESDITISIQNKDSQITCQYEVPDDIAQGIEQVPSVAGDLVWSLKSRFALKGSDTESQCSRYRFFTWKDSDYSFAVAFINGMVALHHSVPGTFVTALKQESGNFASVVTKYRSANPKPTLPPEAQMYATQANDAVSRNQKDQAIALYQKALDVALWWPTGHYNLALLLGDQQDYDDAIAEMEKYLELVPDAPDAQKAQQQIWVWQGRAGEQPVRQ